MRRNQSPLVQKSTAAVSERSTLGNIRHGGKSNNNNSTACETNTTCQTNDALVSATRLTLTDVADITDFNDPLVAALIDDFTAQSTGYEPVSGAWYNSNNLLAFGSYNLVAPRVTAELPSYKSYDIDSDGKATLLATGPSVGVNTETTALVIRNPKDEITKPIVAVATATFGSDAHPTDGTFVINTYDLTDTTNQVLDTLDVSNLDTDLLTVPVQGQGLTSWSADGKYLAFFYVQATRMSNPDKPEEPTFTVQKTILAIVGVDGEGYFLPKNNAKIYKFEFLPEGKGLDNPVFPQVVLFTPSTSNTNEYRIVIYASYFLQTALSSSAINELRLFKFKPSNSATSAITQTSGAAAKIGLPNDVLDWSATYIGDRLFVIHRELAPQRDSARPKEPLSVYRRAVILDNASGFEQLNSEVRVYGVSDTGITFRTAMELNARGLAITLSEAQTQIGSTDRCERCFKVAVVERAYPGVLRQPGCVQGYNLGDDPKFLPYSATPCQLLVFTVKDTKDCDKFYLQDTAVVSPLSRPATFSADQSYLATFGRDTPDQHAIAIWELNSQH